MTQQKVLKDRPVPAEGFPVRAWCIEVYLLDESGKQIPATILEKVTYLLHPTFANPKRDIKTPPFKIKEEGWGEFELGMTLTFIEKCGDVILGHDLNFQQEYYTVDHKIKVPIKKNAHNMRALLKESGPVASEDFIGDKRKNGTPNLDSKSKKSRLNTASLASAVKGNVDLEKLAEGLTKLTEDDLLGVVQMVTDNRTPDMNIKNDVEEGEFTMDLFTLPDGLLKSLWDYVKKRIE